jgi:hypothetical protein
MHIGKSMRMAWMNEKIFEYGFFHEPTNMGTCQPTVMDDQK